MFSLLISMYDEEWTVNETIKNVRRVFAKDVDIQVVQSESGSKVEGMDGFTVVPNLGKTLKRHEIPSASLCRNFGILFNKVREDSEFIVVITGDTLIKDPANLTRRWEDMQRTMKTLACSQALGQDFHAADADPENDKCGGRFQILGIADFMPQFWMVAGWFYRSTGAFKIIENTNKYTSEQCLGDEYGKHISGPFRDNALVLADNAYDYNDGIKYHVRRP